MKITPAVSQKAMTTVFEFCCEIHYRFRLKKSWCSKSLGRTVARTTAQPVRMPPCMSAIDAALLAHHYFVLASVQCQRFAGVFLDITKAYDHFHTVRYQWSLPLFKALSTASFKVPPECPPRYSLMTCHGRGSYGRLRALCFCEEP